MEFTLQREQILKPLQAVAGVVERRQTLPILSNLLIQCKKEKITLTGTDLEVQLVGEIPVAVKDPADITVPARKFVDICRTLPEQSELKISVTGERITVRAGKSRFTLATLPADDFPIVAMGKDAVGFHLSQRQFRELITRTHFAMALQDVRYYLNGLLLELENGVLRAVATDGHRLAIGEVAADVQVPGPRQLIIPRKGVQELLRMLGDQDTPVQLAVSANHVEVRLNELCFTSKLIDGRFPEYQRVIPRRGDKVMEADRELLRQALTRTSILSNEKYRGVRLHLTKGNLRVQAHNPEQEEAEEELEVKYQGETLEIGFNVTYLVDALSAIETERVQVELTDGNSSALIQAVGQDQYRYVVMPMRL
ncbi:MAG: DNA polymerase III subunit beta [Chromatiales bacterium 21-64-14]|nr:MAG: DNA polymerase III subunit beta [Chromatiales bacterium 21-64-14]HQU14584.1 DNA polymerase III subunit beta [Gammaproteobacteria bacterium]